MQNVSNPNIMSMMLTWNSKKEGDKTYGIVWAPYHIREQPASVMTGICPSGSFMVDMGILSNIMQSPSPKCYMTFWDMTIYNDTLNWSDITPVYDLITDSDLITQILEVSIEHCNGCG